MPHDIDTEPVVIKVAAHADVPPSTISAPEWNALKARVTEVEGLGLVDLSDVDPAGLADGLTLVWNEASGTWKPGTSGGTIARIGNAGTEENSYDVNHISVRGGLRMVQSAPGVVFIEGVTGTTAGTLASGAHTHSLRANTALRFTASGSLSSGTRSLTSGTITGLVPANTYIITGRLSGQVRGEGTGAGYSVPRITIDGNTRDIAERPRTVAGVQVSYHLEHPGVSVTGVSSVAVSASIAYSEGDPLWVGGGDLIIDVKSNR
jgi:hypothetical protein